MAGEEANDRPRVRRMHRNLSLSAPMWRQKSVLVVFQSHFEIFALHLHTIKNRKKKEKKRKSNMSEAGMPFDLQFEK